MFLTKRFLAGAACEKECATAYEHPYIWEKCLCHGWVFFFFLHLIYESRYKHKSPSPSMKSKFHKVFDGKSSSVPLSVESTNISFADSSRRGIQSSPFPASTPGTCTQNLLPTAPPPHWVHQFMLEVCRSSVLHSQTDFLSQFRFSQNISATWECMYLSI